MDKGSSVGYRPGIIRDWSLDGMPTKEFCLNNCMKISSCESG